MHFYVEVLHCLIVFSAMCWFIL